MYTIIYTRQRLHSIDGNKNPAFPRYKRKRQNMKAIMYPAYGTHNRLRSISGNETNTPIMISFKIHFIHVAHNWFLKMCRSEWWDMGQCIVGFVR